MFRFVTEQARSVGTFVSKVLSPRTAAADHATRSGLDTALSSSAFDEKFEEAAAESPPRVIAASAVPGGTGSAFPEAAAGLDGEEKEGSQPLAKPAMPKLTPPTPKGAEGGTEAVVSTEALPGVNGDVLEDPPETPNVQRMKGKSSKKGGLQMGGELEESVRGMKRLADLGDEKPKVKRGKTGVKEETVEGAKAGRGVNLGGVEEHGHNQESIRTLDVKKRTPKAGKKVSETEGNGASKERGDTTKEGKRTPKPVKKLFESLEEREAKTGAKGTVSEIGVNEQPTPRAKKAKVAAKGDEKETEKGGDKTGPAKARVKTTAKRQVKGTPKGKAGAEKAANAAEATPKTAGVKRKTDDEGAPSGRKASGGGEGKAAKRGGGQELEGSEYLGKRVKVLWEKGVVKGVRRDTWYEGLVTSYSSKTKLHGVQYDDGDYEDEDLSPASPTKFEILR